MKYLYTLLAVVVLACAPMASLFAAPMLPPLNPAVTQDTIKTTICRVGYTETVRPSTYYAAKVKRVLLLDAHIPLTRSHEFRLDHAEPLGLGGAPRSLENLTLQLLTESQAKDALEKRLNKQVCAGKISLATAQACVWNDWRACAKGRP